MGVEIRRMTLEDIDQVLEIERKSFTTPWSRESYVMEVERNKLARYLVATRGDSLVGYGGFWLVAGEAHITNIAVDIGARGQGVGKLLLKGLIVLASTLGCNSMTLEVRESNLVAQHLYRKHGFVSAGVRPGYYADIGEDAIVMWKTL